MPISKIHSKKTLSNSWIPSVTGNVCSYESLHTGNTFETAVAVKICNLCWLWRKFKLFLFDLFIANNCKFANFADTSNFHQGWLILSLLHITTIKIREHPPSRLISATVSQGLYTRQQKYQEKLLTSVLWVMNMNIDTRIYAHYQ